MLLGVRWIVDSCIGDDSEVLGASVAVLRVLEADLRILARLGYATTAWTHMSWFARPQQHLKHSIEQDWADRVSLTAASQSGEVSAASSC